MVTIHDFDAHDLDDVVTELCRCHPRFRRITIARLVARTVMELSGACTDPLCAAVRRTADEQLSYAEGGPDPRPRGRARQ
jgi:hypothetical protein